MKINVILFVYFQEKEKTRKEIMDKIEKDREKQRQQTEVIIKQRCKIIIKRKCLHLVPKNVVICSQLVHKALSAGSP